MWFLRRRQTKASEEAAEALVEAEKKLHEVQDRGCEVSKVANALKEIRERNHFAEALEEIFFHDRGHLNDS